jgi:DNA polymerase-1
VAATGRLSSNEPNLQNIPIRTELGRQIRRAFVAPDGYELLSLDYSQIELRVLAHMCEDPALVQAFRTGQDVHAATAALMFDEDLGAVTKEQRRLAKLLNYAVLYGVTGYGLSNQLGPGFSPADANALIKQYSERFPTVKAFTDHLVMEARASGFTRTLIGRRRVFPDINAPNWSRRQYAERQAMNAPIQGTAADMIKLAMVDVAREVPADQARLLLQVHDELVFEIPAGERGAVEPVRRLMEQALPLQVPVEVDAKAGPNWLEMEAVPRTAP